MKPIVPLMSLLLLLSGLVAGADGNNANEDLINDLVDRKLPPQQLAANASIPHYVQQLAKQGNLSPTITALIRHSTPNLTVDLIENAIWAMTPTEFQNEALELIKIASHFNDGRVAFIIQFRYFMIVRSPLITTTTCPVTYSPPVPFLSYSEASDKLLKVFANFVGDSFIGGHGVSIIPGHKLRLEGGQSGPAMQYMSELAEVAAKRTSDASLNQLADQLRVGSMLDSGASCSAAFTARIVSLLVDHDLAKMKSIVLPCGWTNVASGGHALTLEITAHADSQDQLTIRVYNAGSGVNYHAHFLHEDRINHGPFIEFNGVPRELLHDTDVILRLLQAANIQGKYDADVIYQSILSPFLPYTNTIPEDPASSVRAQQAGTCTMKSPKLFARARSTTARKIHLEQVAIETTLACLEDFPCSPRAVTWRFVLIQVRANMARRQSKLGSSRAEPNDLDSRTRAVIAILERCMRVPGAAVHGSGTPDATVVIKLSVAIPRPMSNYISMPSSRYDRLKDMKMTFKLKGDAPGRVSWHEGSGGDMTEHLEQLVAWYSGPDTFVNMNMLVSDVIALPLPPTNGPWASLHNADLAHRAVDHIDTLVRLLARSPHTPRTTHYDRTIALVQLLAIAWNLLAITDDLEQVASYALDPVPIKAALFSRNFAPHDVHLSKRAAELLRIIERPFSSNLPPPENILYREVGSTSGDFRYRGITEQHIGWEVQEEARVRARTAVHTRALDETRQVGFLKLISERARLILERQPSFAFNKKQQDEIDQARQDRHVDCSTTVNLIMMMASWEALPIGSLRPMRTVHRAFHALLTLGASYDSRGYIGVVRDTPKRQSRTYQQDAVLDQCYTSVQYTTASTDGFTDRSHFLDLWTKFDRSAPGSAYNRYVMCSTLSTSLRFAIANRPSELIAHFGSGADLNKVKSLILFECAGYTKENEIVVKGGAPREMMWRHILSTPTWSSLPRLLYDWRSGRIKVEDVDEQALIEFALFRFQPEDPTIHPSPWAIASPIAQAIFKTIRETIDDMLKTARDGRRAGSLSSATSAPRSNAISFLITMAFRIVDAIHKSSSSAATLVGRVTSPQMIIGLFNTTSVLTQLRHDLSEFVALQQSSSVSTPKQRSLLATARLQSWAPETCGLKDLLRWQSHRVATHASDRIHHPANMVIARHARSAVKLIVSMSEVERREFISDLIVGRVGDDVSLQATLSGLEWSCGVDKTWCVARDNASISCQVDLTQPDLLCSIGGKYREWRMDAFALSETSWYWDGKARGVHAYVSARATTKMISDSPVTFRITENALEASLWQMIDVSFDIDDVSGMSSSLRPSHVRMYLAPQLAHVSSAPFFVQSDLPSLMKNHPGLKLPRPLHIKTDEDAFHVWIGISSNYVHDTIVTDHAGKVIVTAGSNGLISALGQAGCDHLMPANREWILKHPDGLILTEGSFALDTFARLVNISLLSSAHDKQSHRIVFQHVFIDGHPLVFISSDGNGKWVWERSLPPMHISHDQQLAGFDLRFVAGVLLLEGGATRRALVLSHTNETVALVDLRRELCAATGRERDVFVPSTRLDRLIVANRLLFAADYGQAFDLLRGVDLMTAPDADTTAAMKDLIDANAVSQNPMAVCIRALVVLTDIRLAELYTGNLNARLASGLSILRQYWQIHRNIPVQYRLLHSGNDHRGLFLSRNEEIDLLKKVVGTHQTVPADVIARLAWLNAFRPDSPTDKLLMRPVAIQPPTAVTVASPVYFYGDRAHWQEPFATCLAMKADRAANDLDAALNRYNPLFIGDKDAAMFNDLLPAIYSLHSSQLRLATRVWSFLQLRAVEVQKRYGGDIDLAARRQMLLVRLLHERFPSVTRNIDVGLPIPTSIVKYIRDFDVSKDKVPSQNFAPVQVKMHRLIEGDSGIRADRVSGEFAAMEVPPLLVSVPARLDLASMVMGEEMSHLLRFDRDIAALVNDHIEFTINDCSKDDFEYYSSGVEHDLLPMSCRTDDGPSFVCARSRTVVDEARLGFKRLHEATKAVPRWRDGRASQKKVHDALVLIKSDLGLEMAAMDLVIGAIVAHVDRHDEHIGVGDDLSFRWQSLLPLLVLSSASAYSDRLPNMPRDQIDALHAALFKLSLLVTASQQVDRAIAARFSVDGIARELLQQRQSPNVLLQQPALLVFELMTNIRLRADQVDDIALLTRLDRASGTYKPMILQRLMAAGKTFVIGTLMALLKADGYHLSVMVPPASLFESNAQNMYKWR